MKKWMASLVAAAVVATTVTSAFAALSVTRYEQEKTNWC